MSPELMRNLDYRQLHTFWTFAKEVSVTRASAKLFLAQPTVSGQLRELKLAIGTKLVAIAGRGIVIPASGRQLASYHIHTGYQQRVGGVPFPALEPLRPRSWYAPT